MIVGPPLHLPPAVRANLEALSDVPFDKSHCVYKVLCLATNFFYFARNFALCSSKQVNTRMLSGIFSGQ